MHTAYVTSKGQLAIPAKLRRKFNIKKGTRVNFLEDGGQIIMQPVTRAFIDSVCGMLKRKSGGKPVTQELIEEHAEEVRRDEEKIARHRL
ncbi:MAG TPA: AbrB/MazE/SpoVT family DNA-binding domain-containing protein [Verrucomicrobiae bacterium]|nr:AbrB/MazE/SpoVT family DNA-binding domain-containing protein [Verrucomicrobiae bacterium]